MVTGIRTRQALLYTRARLSVLRYEHCVRVARTSVHLARRHGIDPGSAWLAGLFHDIAREISGSRLLALAGEWGLPVTPEEERMPVLLHGKAGAAMLRRDFPWLPDQVLSAVENHIKGPGFPGKLETILYVADFMEPGRTYFRPEWNRLAESLGLEDLRHWVETTSGLYYKKKSTGEKGS